MATTTNASDGTYFIQKGDTEEFIYSVDPRDYTINGDTHQTRKKFARLGIPKLIGMDVFLVIWICAEKLYHDDYENRERFLCQQLRAWQQLINIRERVATQHAFRWGRDGGGQSIEVCFDALLDENGIVECYTVEVTSKILTAEQYELLKLENKLFCPSPESMAA